MTIIETVEFTVWMLSTGILAIAFTVFAGQSILFAFTRGPRFLILTPLFVLVAAISVLTNPIANTLLCFEANDRLLNDMWRDIQSRNLYGAQPGILIDLYGHPNKRDVDDKEEYWRYSPKVWFSFFTWEDIVVTVQGRKIVSIYRDD